MVVALLIVGLFLRAAHLGHETYNPDEAVGQAVSHGLEFPGQWDTNWALYEVPIHFRYDQYNFSSYHYLLFLWQKMAAGWTQPASEPSLTVLRALNLPLGFIFLGALALTARRQLGPWAPITAIGAAAVFPLLIQDAYYVRCEAMLTAGVAVLLWWSLRERSLPSAASLLGAAMLLGWLGACKATMILALPLLAVRLIPERLDHPIPWATLLRHGSILAAGLLLGFALGVPFGFFQPTTYLAGLQRLALEYSSPFPPYTQPDMAPSRWVALSYFHHTLGWAFWGLVAAGMAKLVRILGWNRALCLAAPVGLALFLFGNHPFFSERSYSPFIPIICLLFGAGFQQLADVFGKLPAVRSPVRAGALALLLLLTLVTPAHLTWKLVFLAFSGREDRAQDVAITQMKGDHQGHEHAVSGFLFSEPEKQAITASIGTGQSVLILVLDANDPVSRGSVAFMYREFRAELLGARENLFADIPTCTLHTFLSQSLWLFHIPPK